MHKGLILYLFTLFSHGIQSVVKILDFLVNLLSIGDCFFTLPPLCHICCHRRHFVTTAAAEPPLFRPVTTPFRQFWPGDHHAAKIVVIGASTRPYIPFQAMSLPLHSTAHGGTSKLFSAEITSIGISLSTSFRINFFHFDRILFVFLRFFPLF